MSALRLAWTRRFLRVNHLRRPFQLWWILLSAPEREALSHIAGLSLCNEGTIRDWVRHAKFNVTQGKNFDRSGSMGPWLVPYAQESQLADIRLTTRVNGALRQDDRTSRMIFPFRKIISYVSTFTTLVPGDVLVCGTPSGRRAV